MINLRENQKEGFRVRMDPKSLFVGREGPLKKLQSLFVKKTASLVVVRGRRRIGKSRLIEEFAKDSRFLLFSGLAPTSKTTAQSQREEFARQLKEQVGIPGLKADDWGDLFAVLSSQVKDGPVIILLDEISWMGSKDPDFLGKLKIAWDTQFNKNSALILVLCGSVSSWIEKNIISSTGFFGRINQKILLDELSLPTCGQMLDLLGFKGSIMEKFMLLSITGGVPWYLELIHPGLPAIENIRELCFEKEGTLFDEFKHIFHDLFGSRGTIYQNIVRQLVAGSSSYQELSNALNYSSGGPLSEYLDDLVLSGYVKKDYTWSLKTGKESRLFRYRLSDNYLRFYLRVIEPNKSKIERGHFSSPSLSQISGWDSMMGFQFENLVLHNRHIIHRALSISPDDIVYDNPFFQRKTAAQEGCQIDYLIQTRFNTLYVCEIKFSKNSITARVIDEVKEKICKLKVPRNFSCIPVLIHINGCSSSLKEKEYFMKEVDFSDVLNH